MQRQAWKNFLWLTGVSLVVSLTVPVLAQNPTAPTNQNPPASTYQPGYWQPIARVKPNSPVTVTLVNQTKVPLKYNLLDERGEKNLPAGASTQLKIVSLPVNIAIYDPSTQAASGKAENFKYETSVTKNNVKAIVMPVTSESEGFNVLNIAKTGAIYAY